jgi:hypothetical protein
LYKNKKKINKFFFNLFFTVIIFLENYQSNKYFIIILNFLNIILYSFFFLKTFFSIYLLVS